MAEATIVTRLPDDLWASVRRFAPILNLTPQEALQAAWDQYAATLDDHGKPRTEQ